jgi:hypothetical protein
LRAIGFEAEFVSQAGATPCIAAILMPLSSDGRQDRLHLRRDQLEGSGGQQHAAASQRKSRAPVGAGSRSSPSGRRPQSDPLQDGDYGSSFAKKQPILSVGQDEEQPSFDLALGDDAGLADRLSLARETAEAVKSSEARSRSALYRALGQAYDFAVAAEQAPEDYAEILEDAGLKAQDRAPMTPIVKLVFGADYDKTRLTEFAAALSHGHRQSLPSGGFADYLEAFTGGLKAVVQAERRERRPEAKPNPGEDAIHFLRNADAAAIVEMDAPDGEFVLLVARREPDGRLAIVAPVGQDQALLDRAIRRVVR